MRPFAGDKEPVFRREQLSLSKLLAEGTPKEIQIILGWLINTRLLIMSLPNDKYLAWKNDIQKLIDSGVVTKEELESIIGRLNHASYFLPLARHFLSGLRERLKMMKRYPFNATNRLTYQEIEDLKLWLLLLATTNQGISLNG